MRSRSEQHAAHILFDAIGRVDDRFIAEAATPYAPPRKTLLFRRVALLAAVLTLLLSITLGLFIGNRLFSFSYKASNAEDGCASGDTHTSASSLAATLEQVKEETRDLCTDPADLDLMSDTPMIVWQYADESVYRVKAITAEECNTLTQAWQSGFSFVTESAQEGDEAALWLVLGNGEVISPCLLPQSGRTEYGTLFAYEPEIEPSSAFTDALYEILS